MQKRTNFDKLKYMFMLAAAAVIMLCSAAYIPSAAINTSSKASTSGWNSSDYYVYHVGGSNNGASADAPALFTLDETVYEDGINTDLLQELREVVSAVSAAPATNVTGLTTERVSKYWAAGDRTAANFSHWASNGKTQQHGAVYIRLFDRLTTGTINENYFTSYSEDEGARWWQVVYSGKDANGNDIITLLMAEGYRSTPYGSKTYYSSTARATMLTDFTGDSNGIGTGGVLGKFSPMVRYAIQAVTNIPWQGELQDDTPTSGADSSAPPTVYNNTTPPVGDKLWLPSAYETVRIDEADGTNLHNHLGVIDTPSKDTRTGLWQMSGYDRGYDLTIAPEVLLNDYTWLRSASSANQASTRGDGNFSAIEDPLLQQILRPAIHISLDAMDVTGNWEVKYEIGEGQSPWLKQTIPHGGVAHPPSPEPVRDGVLFNGWFYDAGATKPYNFNTVVTGNLTLYAKWVLYWTVSFNSNGGTPTPPPQRVPRNTTVNKPDDPTLTDRAFAGWFRGVGGTGTEWNFVTSRVTDNITLYAKWDPIYWVVTFNSQGGTHVNPQNIRHDSYAEEPPVPKRTGYEFLNWVTMPDGMGSTWDFRLPIRQDMTLYAKWREMDRYQVDFNSYGGTAILSQQIYEGGYVSKPTDPVYPGYEFQGWFTMPNGGGIEWDFGTAQVRSSMTLHAKWREYEVYIVEFDSQGGTPVASQEVAETDYAKEPQTTKDGHSFDGWYTEPEGAGMKWNFTKNAVSGDMTLYAKWQVNQLILKLNAANSGATVNGVMEYSYTDYFGAVLNLPVPIFTDGTMYFDGWWDAAYTEKFTHSVMPAFNDNLYLYAKWVKEPQYLVFFNTQAAGIAVPQQVIDPSAKDKTAAEPDDPTRRGHTFGGWYPTMACDTEPYDFSAPVTETSTIYAKWTVNSFDFTFNLTARGEDSVQSVPFGANVGKYVDIPASDAASDYAVLGWYTKDGTLTDDWGMQFDFYTVMTEEPVTVYAKWGINKSKFTDARTEALKLITSEYETYTTVSLERMTAALEAFDALVSNIDSGEVTAEQLNEALQDLVSRIGSLTLKEAHGPDISPFAIAMICIAGLVLVYGVIYFFVKTRGFRKHNREHAA